MEVRESAACGISQREFTMDFDTEELPDTYRIFRYAKDGTGFFDDGYLEEMKSQMTYIIGPALQEEPPESVEGILHWEEEGGSFHLILNEEEARKLWKIFSGVDHPGEGFDRGLLQKLMDQMMDLAPGILQNLPVINR